MIMGGGEEGEEVERSGVKGWEGKRRIGGKQRCFFGWSFPPLPSA